MYLVILKHLQPFENCETTKFTPSCSFRGGLIHYATQARGIPGAFEPSPCGGEESRNQESTVEIRHCQSQAQVEVTIKAILDTNVVISGLASQR
jgi:hypothetical protein